MSMRPFLSLVIFIIATVYSDDSLISELKSYMIEYGMGMSHSMCSIFHKNGSHEIDDVVDMALGTLQCPSAILTGKVDSERSFFKSNANFIFLDTIKDILIFIDVLMYAGAWNPHGENHFIICKRVNATKMLRHLRKVLPRVWTREVYYYVVAFVVEKLEVYSYNPFLDEFVDKRSCNNCQLFEPIVNMYGKPLTIAVTDYPPLIHKDHNGWQGVDVELAKSIASVLNAKPLLVDRPGILNQLKVLHDDSFDIFGVTILFPWFREGVSVSYPVRSNKLIAMIPKSKEIPPYITLLDLFESQMMLSVFFMLILVSITNKLVYIRYRIRITILECVSKTWEALLQKPIVLDDSPLFSKFILMLWIFLAIYVTTIFQSFLLNIFMNPKFFDDIETIEELRNSPFTIYSMPEHEQLVMAKNLNSRLKHASLEEMDKLIYENYESNVYILKYTSAKYYQKQLAKKLHYPVYHIIEEPFSIGFDEFVLKKNTPYLKTINRLISVHFQISGTDHLKGDSYENWEETPQNRVLTLKHFVVMFMMLIVGYSMGFLVFLGEIYWGKFRRLNA